MPDDTAAPKWTPGPWGIVELSPREVLLKRRHWAVGQVRAPAKGVGLAFGETGANARLIAAAPSLYEALAKLLRQCETSFTGWPATLGEVEARNEARAALALARGETP